MRRSEESLPEAAAIVAFERASTVASLPDEDDAALAGIPKRRGALIPVLLFGGLMLGGVIVYAMQRPAPAAVGLVPNPWHRAPPPARPSVSRGSRARMVAHAASGSAPPSASVHPTAPPVPPSPPAAASSEYTPTNAIVSLQPLATERVQRGALEHKMTELAPRFTECYRDALGSGCSLCPHRRRPRGGDDVECACWSR